MKPNLEFMLKYIKNNPTIIVAFVLCLLFIGDYIHSGDLAGLIIGGGLIVSYTTLIIIDIHKKKKTNE